MEGYYARINSIGNHYEPILREVGNQEMKQSAEVKIENEEETSNQKEQKFEASTEDKLSMVGEASIKDEPPMAWDIPTPISHGRNYQYEDASVPTEEEGPLDLTMKPKKKPSTTKHIPITTEKKSFKPKTRCWINFYQRRK